jgi:hypothetical protein
LAPREMIEKVARDAPKRSSLNTLAILNNLPLVSRAS